MGEDIPQPPETPKVTTYKKGYKTFVSYDRGSDADQLINVNDKLPEQHSETERASHSSGEPAPDTPIEAQAKLILSTTKRWDRGLVLEKIMGLGMSQDQAKIFIIKHRPDLA